MVKGHGKKPPNPLHVPKSHGKKRAAPKPPKGGAHPCERSIIGQGFIRTVNLMDRLGFLGGNVGSQPHSS